MGFARSSAYLYHGGRADLDHYIRSVTARSDNLTSFQMSLSVGYTANHGKKKAGNRLWQISIPRTLYNDARSRGRIEPHTSNPYQNFW
jgi:hypothetical protein